MFIAIHHDITDPKAWEETTSQIGPMIEQGRLPKGLKPLYHLPGTDGRRADCLWESDSIWVSVPPRPPPRCRFCRRSLAESTFRVCVVFVGAA